VNLTAAWCITCKVNERVALAAEPVRQAFAARGIATLTGDWTRGDPAITAVLRGMGGTACRCICSIRRAAARRASCRRS